MTGGYLFLHPKCQETQPIVVDPLRAVGTFLGCVLTGTYRKDVGCFTVSSHNHGSEKWVSTYLSNKSIFQIHDHGRKSKHCFFCQSSHFPSPIHSPLSLFFFEKKSIPFAFPRRFGHKFRFPQGVPSQWSNQSNSTNSTCQVWVDQLNSLGINSTHPSLYYISPYYGNIYIYIHIYHIYIIPLPGSYILLILGNPYNGFFVPDLPFVCKMCAEIHPKT